MGAKHVHDSGRTGHWDLQWESRVQVCVDAASVDVVDAYLLNALLDALEYHLVITDRVLCLQLPDSNGVKRNREFLLAHQLELMHGTVHELL